MRTVTTSANFYNAEVNVFFLSEGFDRETLMHKRVSLTIDLYITCTMAMKRKVQFNHQKKMQFEKSGQSLVKCTIMIDV